MRTFLVRVVSRIRRQIVKWFLLPELKLEWKMHQAGLTEKNERPMEFSFAMKQLSDFSPLEVLDVGSGFTAWPHLMANCGFRVTAIDEIDSYWKGAMFNRHYYVQHDDITKSRLHKQFDFVTCISVIEHIPNHKAAIKGMFNLLKNGGHLVITFPYNEHKYVNNVYELPEAGYGQNNPFICQVYSRKELDEWVEENNGIILEQEYYEFFTGELWTFGERIYPARKTTKDAKHHLSCVLFEKL